MKTVLFSGDRGIRRACMLCVIVCFLSSSPVYAQGLTELQDLDIPKGFTLPKDEQLDVDITVGAGYNTNSQVIGLFAYEVRNLGSRQYPDFREHVDAASPIYPYRRGLSFPPVEYPGYNINPFYPWPRYSSNSRTFTFQAQPGQLWNDYYFQYLEPDVTDYNLKGLAKTYWFRRDFFVRSQSEYVVQRLGGLLGLQKQVTSKLGLSLTYRNEFIRILDLAPDVPPPIRRQTGGHNLAMWRAELTYKNLDSNLYHQNGYYILTSALLAGLPAGSTINFWRIRGGATWFIRLWNFPEETPNVLELRGLVGLTGPAFGDEEVPFYERFFAGGFGTVRGYAFRSITPLENEVPVGGNQLVIASAEYGWQFLDPYLRPFVFVDTGTVTANRTFDFWSEMRGAVGVGIDFYNAGGVFPVEFDYIPLHFNTQPGDITSLFSFALMISF